MGMWGPLLPTWLIQDAQCSWSHLQLVSTSQPHAKEGGVGSGSQVDGKESAPFADLQASSSGSRGGM